MEVLSGKPCWSYASLFIPSSHIPICQSINHCTVFIQHTRIVCLKMDSIWFPWNAQAFVMWVFNCWCFLLSYLNYYHGANSCGCMCCTWRWWIPNRNKPVFVQTRTKNTYIITQTGTKKTAQSGSTKPQEQRTGFTLIYDIRCFLDPCTNCLQIEPKIPTSVGPEHPHTWTCFRSKP